MRKHPDADTFVLEHLRRPAEATTRLVFADWLDETGSPSNSAWAEYIRLRERAEREAARDADLQARVAHCSRRIKANLTLSARALAPRFESLTLLLPLANVTVRLAGYEVPRAVLDLMPASVAHENLLLPLAAGGDALLVACPDPQHLETQRRLEFILNRRITLVRAAPDDLRAALAAAFGPYAVESIDSPLTEYTTPDLAPTTGRGGGDAVAQVVNLLLLDPVNKTFAAFRFASNGGPRAARVRLRPVDGGLTVCDANGADWVERTRLPARAARPVLTRLAVMADLDVGRVYAPPLTVHPLYGRFTFAVQSARFEVGVTAHPSPDGPTLDLDIREAR